MPNPLLWGSLTALLSLVPMAGTALVWMPWTIYLFATGSVVRAVIFLALQLVAVGGADNILRPLLMEGRMKMHTLVIFFSILGGISYFGILGIFIGLWSSLLRSHSWSSTDRTTQHRIFRRKSYPS